VYPSNKFEKRPRAPGIDVRDYVKYLQVKYAKGRAKGRRAA